MNQKANAPVRGHHKARPKLSCSTKTIRNVAKFPGRNRPPSLRSTMDLAARELDPILRIKLFQLSANASRKQIVHFYAKDTRKNEQFEIGDTPLLIFKARDRFPTGVPSEQLEFDGKLVLGPSLQLAKLSHLGADNIQLFNIFFDACTLAIAGRASCRRYQTL